MKASKKNVVRKRPGRPATGQDPVTAIRLSQEMRADVDRWAADQDDEPGRSEAIRRLVDIGLKAKEKRFEESRARREAESISGTPTIQKQKQTPRIKPEDPKKL
jgi:hypothetical protein